MVGAPVGPVIHRSAAVDVRHRPALRPRERCATTGSPTRPGCRSTTCPALLDGADLVVVRILGGAGPGRTGSTAVARRAGVPVVVLGGEQAPDAELMELSRCRRASRRRRTPTSPRAARRTSAQLHAFLSDTVLLTGDGFEPPASIADAGACWSAGARRKSDGPIVAVLYYRAQHVAGNTALRRGAVPRDRGRRAAVRCRCTAPRCARRARRCSRRSRAADALVVTVLAAGGTSPATASARRRRRGLGRRRAGRAGRPDPAGPLPDQLAAPTWEDSDDGLSPLDVGDPGRGPRVRRPASSPCRSRSRRSTTTGSRLRRRPRARAPGSPGSRCATPGCGTSPPRDKRIALMLSAYPTKHSRIGNAVGLDTPASAVALLRAHARRGLRLRSEDGCPAWPTQRRRRADPRADRGGGQDPDWLTEEQLAGNPVRIPAARLPRAGSPRCPRDLPHARRASTGARRRASCSSTAATTPTARSCSPRCAPATSC